MPLDKNCSSDYVLHNLDIFHLVRARLNILFVTKRE
jgi:hypothetical protein